MKDWGIIYTSEYPPAPYPWEALTKAPLRVRAANEERLPAFSRLCYSKTFAIEHRFPVLEIGTVSQSGMELL